VALDRNPSTATAAPGAVRVVVNIVAFEIGWFACVLGAAHGRPMLGLAVAAAVIAIHLWLAAERAREALLIGAAVALGAIWDTSMGHLGWIAYAAAGPWSGFAPLWILALWALFATTLDVSMRRLQTRPLLAALLGLVGGPLSYLGAARLGACELVERGSALAAQGVGWALITPLLLTFAGHLHGRRSIWERSSA
jgi:hypothetical protein